MTVTVRDPSQRTPETSGQARRCRTALQRRAVEWLEVDRLRYLGAVATAEVSVTFPARPFNVNGDKTNFALLRAIDDPKAQNQVRELVMRAYAEHEQHAAEVTS